MVACKTCNKEIANGAICPGCGRNNQNIFLRILKGFFKHPIRNLILLILAGAFFELVFMSLFS